MTLFATWWILYEPLDPKQHVLYLAYCSVTGRQHSLISGLCIAAEFGVFCIKHNSLSLALGTDQLAMGADTPANPVEGLWCWALLSKRFTYNCYWDLRHCECHLIASSGNSCALIRTMDYLKLFITLPFCFLIVCWCCQDFVPELILYCEF